MAAKMVAKMAATFS